MKFAHYSIIFCFYQNVTKYLTEMQVA